MLALASAGMLEISRSTINVYWTRIEHLTLTGEEWEALSDLEVSRLLRCKMAYINLIINLCDSNS